MGRPLDNLSMKPTLNGGTQASMRTIMQRAVHEVVAGLVILFSGVIAVFGQESNLSPVLAVAGAISPQASNLTTTVTVAPPIVRMGDWLTVTVENPPAAFVNAITAKKKPAL